MLARKKRTLRAKFFRGVVKLLVAFLVFTVAPILLMRFVDPPTSMFILRDRIESFSQADYQFQQQWVAMQKIADPMKLAVIAAEDQLFLEHEGFDLKSIEEAWETRQQGGRLRGASTISQQVAKNIFLWRESTWLRKGVEVYLTTLLELCWSKERILEVYLNVAEFGRGVYGVEAAAQQFFGKSAAALNGSEAARLAAVLPSPRSRNVAKPSKLVLSRQRWIERQVRNFNRRELLSRLAGS